MVIYIYRGSSVKVGICRNKRFQEPVDLSSQLNPGHSLGPPDKGSIKRTRTAKWGWKWVWVNHCNSLIWIKANWGWFHLLTNDSQWGRDESSPWCISKYHKENSSGKHPMSRYINSRSSFKIQLSRNSPTRVQKFSFLEIWRAFLNHRFTYVPQISELKPPPNTLW